MNHKKSRQGNKRLKRSNTHQQQIFGLHSVTSFLQQSPQNLLQLFVQKGRVDKKIQTIQQLADQSGIKPQQMEKKKMDDWCNANHQGVIAEIKVFDAVMDEDELIALVENKTDLLLLILDGVTDPHNLGACLRTADAAGVDALIIPKDRAVGLTPVARKVACGAAETLPIVKVTNLARFIQKLKQYQLWVVGTSDQAEQALFDAKLSGAMALVMGAEGNGMRRLTTEACDQLISIPMAGSVSSLNVSVATGICLFEINRQRKN